MSQPALSICIATMNRAAFIGATLDSIISQANDAVEIVLVDGASTDNTGDIIRQYQERFPRITYVRLPVKGGVDQDYSRAVELATGDYCWLFTDDDVLKPGALDPVLSEVSRAEHDLIVVNAEVRDTDLSAVLEPRCMAAGSDRRNYSASEAEQLFIDTASYLSFIGGVVIRRAVWNARDKASYFGTVFVHVGVIFQAPLPCGAVVLGEPRIAIRYGNALWTSKSFEISMFKWPQLIWSFTHFSDDARQAVTPPEPWRTWTALLVYRARAAYFVADYRRLLRDRMTSKTERAWARIVAMLPACLLNLLMVGYLSVLGRRRSTPELRLVDLRSSSSYYRHCLSRWLARIRPVAGRASSSA